MPTRVDFPLLFFALLQVLAPLVCEWVQLLTSLCDCLNNLLAS